MVELVPTVETAQVVTVLFFKLFAVHMEIIAKAVTAYRTGIEIFLLKKKRILVSFAFLWLPCPNP